MARYLIARPGGADEANSETLSTVRTGFELEDNFLGMVLTAFLEAGVLEETKRHNATLALSQIDSLVRSKADLMGWTKSSEASKVSRQYEPNGYNGVLPNSA
ncbi:hypothetical protein HK101_007244 [Irineochytrium annulatum]|nr:hypothetical protein HK101_007244 [Irineochytrium annulatum]